jgi:formyl-CoA transferase
LLGDFGAEVILIEPPGGHPARSIGPFYKDERHPEKSLFWFAFNTSKKGVTLDIARPDGQKLLKELVRQTDIVVESFAPGYLDALGLGYAALSSLKPDLIFTSISPFGQTGPLAGRPGFDQIAQGMGGLMSVTGLPEQGPVRVGIPIADLCAGIFAAQGILVALLERETSGKGQWLHTSLLESMVYMMDFQTSRWLIDGEVAGQAGNYHPTSIPTGVYKARDGYMNIAVFGSKIWERFCNILGAPEWIADSRYHDKSSRSENRDSLNAEINQRLAAHDRRHWIEQFNEGGVACGVINDMREVFEDPQVQHLGLVKEVVSQRLGPQRVVGQPVELERTPSTIARAAPRRGEHSEEILLELGLSSRAGLALVPIQDVLGLGSAARMNRPGEVGGNWSWRLAPGQRWRQESITGSLFTGWLEERENGLFNLLYVAIAPDGSSMVAYAPHAPSSRHAGTPARVLSTSPLRRTKITSIGKRMKAVWMLQPGRSTIPSPCRRYLRPRSPRIRRCARSATTTRSQTIRPSSRRSVSVATASAPSGNAAPRVAREKRARQGRREPQYLTYWGD